MNGREGPEAEEVRAFGASIVTATGIPVDYQDERWTTVEAERMLRSGGVRRRRREKRRDQIAAALLLQTYLERGAS